MRRIELFLSCVLVWVPVGCDGAPPTMDAGRAASDGGLASSVGATTIEDAPGAGRRPFGDPERATNGVRGAGTGAGSLDVYSIEYGSYLVLSWGGGLVRNGPGVDFAVFENPFALPDGTVFMDQVVVELSLDGAAWVPFPYDYTAPDEHQYSAEPDHWPGFAGVHPVTLNADDFDVDPFDAELAGGDGFDLDALPQDGEAGRIRERGFAFVRLSPARDHVNPDTGEPFPRDPSANGPDIDGVIARVVELP
ncbi:MAG: LIC_13355 family lipoprotein [Sandaracinaceae bacterium]|nr:LIC_13355 family lipoprotein [Sandaracinaceae bacterium]